MKPKFSLFKLLKHWQFSFFLTFLLGGIFWFWIARNSPATAWDFTEFYIAGNISFSSLYDRNVFVAYGIRALLPIGIKYYPPYVRPAVFAIPLKYMMWFPYWTAYCTWAFVQFISYITTIILLYKRYGFPLIFLMASAIFYPAMFGIVQGQDICIYTLLFVLGLGFLQKGSDITAGSILSLGLYKFNLFLLIPVFLILKKRYRAFVSFAGAGILLVLCSVLLSEPNQYIKLLQNIQAYTTGFSPERMIGLRGLFHTLKTPFLYFPATCIIVVSSLIAIQRLNMPEAFGVAVIGSIMVSYHVAWYDGALAIIPIMLALRKEGPMFKVIPAIMLLFPYWDSYPAVASCMLLALLFLFISTIFKPEMGTMPK
jgi:hypothetical protein